MDKLTRADLYSLEQYSETRADFRSRVMAHKKNRNLAIGPNATLYFEDRLTIQYQIQEILRVEKIFEAADIEEELAAYNPLIPDGRNWKATFMLEFPDPAERRRRLAELVGIEDTLWLRVAGHEPVYPIADEDLARDTEDKTSSVHFLRFELQPQMIESLRDNADLAAGIDHSNYRHALERVPDTLRTALIADLG